MRAARPAGRIAPVRYAAKGLLSLLRCWTAPVLELMYPPVCAACDTLCDGGDILCHGCRDALDGLSRAPACERCASPLAHARAPCPWCRGRGRAPFTRIVCLGLHHEPLRTLVQKMKYEGRWSLGEFLARRLLERPDAASLLARSDRIVPVPLHVRRHIRRGYNQAEVVARCLARASGRRMSRALKRVRDTETQAALRSREARYANVRGAFRLADASALAGRNVVIVDDVITTGATAHEVARMLRQARPASISAIFISMADPRDHRFRPRAG